MNAASDKLTRRCHKLAEAMYKATPHRPDRWRRALLERARTGTDEPKKDEGVIDAEYVDVDEKK